MKNWSSARSTTQEESKTRPKHCHKVHSAPEAELKMRTLTNLYNARPTWIENAHARLDAAVFTAYGWPLDLTDDEILQELLALNHARSGGGH